MKTYLTKERYEELKAELQRLKIEGRMEIADRLKKSKDYGDLSENSEYSDAKDAQAKLEAKIFDIEESLKEAVIIKKSANRDIAGVGSTVEAQKGMKIVVYTIVGSNESKPEDNLISNESPLGRAFLGRKAGDMVEMDAPSGKIKYKILKVT
ncbi:MAG: transcription elongation factor GreA [Candidatus Paceibacterota bacterium]